MDDPSLWTPSYLLSARYSLSISCDTCRVLRDVDLLALDLARGNQPVSEMKFRCSVCKGNGEAIANRNLEAWVGYNLTTGERWER